MEAGKDAEDNPKGKKRSADSENQPEKKEKRARSATPADKEEDKSEILRRLALALDDLNSSESGSDDEDPLLEVPSPLDPERLGFLVCAQETLRFLYRRGIPHHHPIFANLRSRFITGLNQMGLD